MGGLNSQSRDQESHALLSFQAPGLSLFIFNKNSQMFTYEQLHITHIFHPQTPTPQIKIFKKKTKKQEYPMYTYLLSIPQFFIFKWAFS